VLSECERCGNGKSAYIPCNQDIPPKYCRIRRLTPRECFRLQGFSDNMFECASLVNGDSQLYRQAGNSVTISVVYAIGEKIMKAHMAQYNSIDKSSLQ